MVKSARLLTVNSGFYMDYTGGRINRNIFNWANIRWLLAAIIHQIFLLTSSIISGTGSFKAIPTLFTILGFPAFLIPAFCWLAASTAFVCSYVQFDDSMSKAAYYFIDICKNLFEQYFLRKKDPYEAPAETLTPVEQLQLDLEIKQTELQLLKQTNQASCTRLLSLDNSMGKLIKYQSALTPERYQHYLDSLNNIQTRISPNHIDTKDKITPKIPVTLPQKALLLSREIYNILIKIFSMGLILLGCAVVIGMGIITTQAFIAYLGIPVTGKWLITGIVLASSIKQLCQMTLTTAKQFQFYSVLFGISPSETQRLNNEIIDISLQIDTQKKIKKELENLEQNLKQEPNILQYQTHKSRFFHSLQMQQSMAAGQADLAQLDTPSSDPDTVSSVSSVSSVSFVSASSHGYSQHSTHNPSNRLFKPQDHVRPRRSRSAPR